MVIRKSLGRRRLRPNADPRLVSFPVRSLPLPEPLPEPPRDLVASLGDFSDPVVDVERKVRPRHSDFGSDYRNIISLIAGLVFARPTVLSFSARHFSSTSDECFSS